MSNNIFDIQNGVLVSYSGSDSDVTIPENVAKIGANAFADCDTLAAISLHAGVTEVCDHAFLNCLNLTTVNVLGDCVIAHTAFVGCTNIKDVNLHGDPTIGRDPARCMSCRA